ncbi:hypothetical protein [Longimycelium tulufanense]|nr:hypothetical protein [Longimycelium tulufanense]
MVPDPDAPAEVFGYSLPAGGNDQAAGPTTLESASGVHHNGRGCWITHQGVRKPSTLGFTLYIYMARVDYCVDGSRVTSVHQKYHYLQDPDVVVYLRGYTGGTPRDSGTGGWRSDVAIHGHIELCAVKIACYASLYPRVDMVIYGSGRAEWSAVT